MRIGNTPVENCTLPSSEFRKSFRDASVEEVAIRGSRAAARFTNGEAVELVGPPAGDSWMIHKFGETAGRGFFQDPVVAGQAVTEKDVTFSFRAPTTGGWERFSSIATDKSAGGPISLNKSIVGPQGAEAIVFWTSFPAGDYADPCARLLSPKVGSSAADLAAAVSRAPGTELVTGPSNVTLGGRPAKHVTLTVRENVGCDPGFFYSWRLRDVYGGAFWRTGVGDTIKVWIVDVDGTRLFIEAATTPQAVGGLKQEAEQIVESIRFESPIGVD